MQFSLQPNKPSFNPIAIPSDRPVYRLKEQIYADDELFEAGQIIIWEDVPNMAMEPMNDKATEMFSMFISDLDKFGKEVAKKTGKSYKSLADAFKNASVLAKQDSRRIEPVNAKEKVTIMGAEIKKRGYKLTADTSTGIELNNKLNTHSAVNEAFMGRTNE